MKKSKFNLTHNASLTADMGKLVPFCVLDCIPNDSFSIKLQSFVRAQPMLAPLMHQVNLYTQYWFVPYRLLWNNWTDFITGGLSGSATPEFPTIKVAPEISSLADYFGIPVLNNGSDASPSYQTFEVSALPFRAYAEIWNTRYRDEDLQDEVAISYDDGLDETTNTDLLSPSWRKDYFTTARPFTQRGSQISVPVNVISSDSTTFYNCDLVLNSSLPYHRSGGRSDVGCNSITISKDFFNDVFSISGNTFDVSFKSVSISVGSPDYATTVNVPSVEFGNLITAQVTASSDSSWRTTSDNFSVQFKFDNKAVSSATSTTTSDVKLTTKGVSVPVVFKSYVTGNYNSVNVRDLRLSSALQRYQERSLEYGNRYEEFIQREFGIKPRDSRIQRPEYLGGGENILQISEVLQTAEGANTGVGTMRGHGISTFANRGIRFRCPEHGIIVGLLSIRPSAVYTQGLNRFWRKFSKLDYFVPELANIGMQEVFTSEVYATGSNYDSLFGYAPRYAEYRSQPNRISGEFRTILDFWNLARKFDEAPSLNSDFLKMNPSKRVFAEQTQNSFLIMLRNVIRAYRVVPKVAKNILK